MKWDRVNSGIVLAVVSVGVAVGVRGVSAQRLVEGTVIISDSMPDVRIELDSSLTYVGTQTVMLSGATRAEQHFFVEADGERISRLYWLQFEGKPAGSGRPYTYARDAVIESGGREFRANFRNYPTSGFAGSPGSDGDQAQRLLEREGYTMGTDLMRVRLVWLLGDPAWDELMIIYLEDLADHDLTVERLREDEDLWKRAAAGLQSRALAGMRFTPR